MSEEFDYTLKINIKGNNSKFYGVVLEDNFGQYDPENPEDALHKSYAAYTLLHVAISLAGSCFPQWRELGLWESTSDIDHDLMLNSLLAVGEGIHKHLSTYIAEDEMFVCSCQLGNTPEQFIGVIDMPEGNDEEEFSEPETIS